MSAIKRHKIGDRVMWNRNPSDAGTVVAVEGDDYIVRWDDGRETAIISGSSQAERTSSLVKGGK